MKKVAKSVTLDISVIERLERDGEDNGRDFSAEVNYACKKYLGSLK